MIKYEKNELGLLDAGGGGGGERSRGVVPGMTALRKSCMISSMRNKGPENVKGSAVSGIIL